MKEQIKSRLEELQSEYQKGQEKLNALEQESASTQASMLRINGAIKVLQELLELKVDLVEKKLVENGMK